MPITGSRGRWLRDAQFASGIRVITSHAAAMEGGGLRGLDAVACWEPAAGDASSATAGRVCSTSEHQRIGQNDGCLNATPSSEGEAGCLIAGGLFFCGCQERHDRVGDGIGASPGQVADPRRR
jgi:hypothetical protein